MSRALAGHILTRADARASSGTRVEPANTVARGHAPVLRRRRQRGTILVVVLLIVVALAGMVLVLGRQARVEAMASANHVAGARAAAVQRAAEQYVLALVAAQRTSVMGLDESYFEAVNVGDAGAFWVVRPDYDDAEMPAYGLVDEGGKLNVNSASSAALLAMPGMPPELAHAIVDWRDGDSDVSTDGAEDAYYQALPASYRCKNGPLESVEEVLLLRGADPELLFGTRGESERLAASSLTGGITGGGFGGGAAGDEMLHRGLFDYLTVYSVAPAAPQPAGGGGGGGGGGQQQPQRRVGRINVNTAPREVLMTLPNLTESDVSLLISRRPSLSDTADAGADTGLGGGAGTGTGGGSGTATDPTNTEWVNEVLNQKAAAVQPLIIGQSYQFSADIVAASADGRAFRRGRIVVDASDEAGPPKVVYRTDLTDRGWPLDPSIIDSLRAGQGVAARGVRGGIGSGAGGGL